MRWSVSVVAEGDRVVTAAEIVELADAVASSNGIASGIGTTSYGAQLVVDAASTDEAVERALAEFRRAAARAGLPAWPVTGVETIAEDDAGEESDPSSHRSRPRNRHSDVPIANISEDER